jgi:hypothetical protein
MGEAEQDAQNAPTLVPGRQPRQYGNAPQGLLLETLAAAPGQRPSAGDLRGRLCRFIRSYRLEETSP